MLFTLVIVIHVILSLFLIGVILLQGGRGGLGEALGGAAAQSLFGGGANTVMTRVTAVSATLFMVTCLALAALSTAQGQSVLERMPATAPGTLPVPPGALPLSAPAPEHPQSAPQPSQSALPSGAGESAARSSAPVSAPAAHPAPTADPSLTP